MRALLLLHRRCRPQGRGHAVRLGELQRLERVDQAGAKIVVALARPKPLCTRGQNAADVGGRELGLRSSSSATMPLTWAAATEVPVVSW